MGWASGGDLFITLCEKTEKLIKDDTEFEEYVRMLVDEFENFDADTIFDYMYDNRTGEIMKKIAKERGYFA